MSSSSADHQHEQEVEVDATLIFRKLTKLRTSNENIELFQVTVYEVESPYVMIFVVRKGGKSNEQVIRMDVVKQDLAKELHLWLFGGKKIEKPAFCLSKRVENVIQAFVNTNKTPKQEDLIMWILSRSEVSLGNQSAMKFGGFDSSAVNRVTLNNATTTGGQSIRSGQKQLTCDFSPSNSKLVESIDKSSAADVATFALMKKLLGSRAAAMNHLNQAKLRSLTASSGASRQQQDSQSYEEIERRKTIRAAQLSAYKLLRSDGKKYPEQKKAMPPARARSGTSSVSKRPASAPVKMDGNISSMVENEEEQQPTREAAAAPIQRRSSASSSRTGSRAAEFAKNEVLKGGLTTATAAWASAILDRQARLEKRIGRNYY